MSCLPKAAEPLVCAFSVAFTRPTFQRVAILILGAILSLRHRTVTAMLRVLGPLASGFLRGSGGGRRGRERSWVKVERRTGGRSFFVGFM